MLSLSGGSSAWTSGVRRFTREPVWSSGSDDDDASCATTLLVRRRHPPPAEAALRVRVMDSRALRDDDTLGEAEAPLASLLSDSDDARARRVVELSLSCGGVVRLAVRYSTIEKELQKRDAAAQERAEQADGDGGISAGGVVPPAVMRRWATGDAPLPTPASLMAAAAAALAPGAATESAAAAAAGVTDTDAEASWGAPDVDCGWTQLADASSASAPPAAVEAVTAASDFEKLCFIFEPRTDTQVALWRAAAQPHSRRRRTLVVAFRGTETSSVTDILTDVRLAMRPFTPGADDVEARSGDDADGSAAAMMQTAAQRRWRRRQRRMGRRRCTRVFWTHSSPCARACWRR